VSSNGQFPAAEPDEAFAALLAEAAPPLLGHPAAQFDEAVDWLGRGGDEALATGFADLDDLVGGLLPRTMTVIAARPSVGKTVGGLCIASHVADVLGFPVLYTSLEMAAQQLALRRMACIADVPLRHLTRADPSGDDWARIKAAAPRLRDTPLRIDETSPAGLAHIRAALAEMDVGGAPARLHILDYLGLASMARAESRQQAVADFARGYRQMAKDLGIPVIALVQLNRNLESRRSRKPQLSDLRESGEIEQTADVVILLHRDDVSAAGGLIEFIVAKNRQGAQGVVTLPWQGTHSRIADRAALWTPSACAES
jgi:replicative DNA helicase